MSKSAETALLVRLPAHLKAWLKSHAEANERNMTSEIKHMIKAAMSAETQKETIQ